MEKKRVKIGLVGKGFLERNLSYRKFVERTKKSLNSFFSNRWLWSASSLIDLIVSSVMSSIFDQKPLILSFNPNAMASVCFCVKIIQKKIAIKTQNYFVCHAFILQKYFNTKKISLKISIENYVLASRKSLIFNHFIQIDTLPLFELNCFSPPRIRSVTWSVECEFVLLIK